MIRVCVVIIAVSMSASAYAQDETISPPDRRDVQTEVLQALPKLGVKNGQSLDQIQKLLADKSATTPRDVLELVVNTFAAAHPETGRFVEACRAGNFAMIPPKPPRLENPPEIYANNIALFHGRYLAQRRMFDEGLTVLNTLEPKQTVDPASCLFFKAVCQQQLLKRDAGLKSLDMLLNNTVGVPTSYRQVGDLMHYELENLKEKSLGEVARMMKDVERRLDLGRGGQRVQKREDEIVARLDEIIEKLEQQKGNSSSSSQSQQNGQQQQPANAAKDSSIKGQKGPGEVDKKRVAGNGGWGMLDKKAETRARAAIKRNFPSHYSEAIKRYNLKLAK